MVPKGKKHMKMHIRDLILSMKKIKNSLKKRETYMLGNMDYFVEFLVFFDSYELGKSSDSGWMILEQISLIQQPI
jgi:hypothetical protein